MEKMIEIPEGYEARIDGNKVILESKESEDERIRENLLQWLKLKLSNPKVGFICEEMKQWIAWLERQGEQKEYPKEVIDNAVSFLTYRNDGMPEKEARDIVNSIISVIKPEYWPRYANMQNRTEWSEEDEITTQRIIDIIWKYATSPHSIINGDKPNLEYAEEFASWFKSLKNRVQPQPKQEWSEEDENWMKYFENVLEFAYNNDARVLGKGCLAGKMWLKALKERYAWKPSDEQINTLWDAIVYVEGCNSNFKGSGSVLENLYSDLKKLKG